MKRKALFSLVLATVLASLSANAWAAGPDTATFSSITTTPGSTMNGQNVNVTNTVAPGDTINLSFTLGTDSKGTTTTYPDTVSSRRRLLVAARLSASARSAIVPS
jgi:hypothetical protein